MAKPEMGAEWTKRFDTLPRALAVGLAVRVVLLVYGTWQDENLVVKYSDVDYQVFSDAAAHVWAGESPFKRATYRYTPLLAWALTPNVWLSRAFGKLLFVLCDLKVAAELVSVLRLRGSPDAIFWAYTWLLNPFSINISTRGNADSVICLLILLTGRCLLERRTAAAGVWFGLAVHLRIFPILFAPAIVLFIDDKFLGKRTGQLWWRQAFLERAKFAAVSGGLFLGLWAALYRLYGWAFLYEGYFYHLVRTDNRHNFSVYFYSLYLHYGRPLGFVAGLASFVPQLAVQASAVWALHPDIVFCMCVQTMAFVAFNKVCTAQYFCWYACLLPAALPCTGGRLRGGLGAALAAAWFATEASWLFSAYQLEFKGLNTFFRVWLSGLGFFAANLAVLSALVWAAMPLPSAIAGFTGALRPYRTPANN